MRASAPTLIQLRHVLFAATRRKKDTSEEVSFLN